MVTEVERGGLDGAGLLDLGILYAQVGKIMKARRYFESILREYKEGDDPFVDRLYEVASRVNITLRNRWNTPRV